MELDDFTESAEDRARESAPESAAPLLIVLEIIKGYCSDDTIRGHIEDIRFENIQVTASGTPSSGLCGYDEEHMVQRVTIENLRINGKVASDLEEGGLTQNKFARDITIRH